MPVYHRVEAGGAEANPVNLTQAGLSTPSSWLLPLALILLLPSESLTCSLTSLSLSFSQNQPSLPPLFLFPPHNTQESKVRRHVTDEETEAERYLFSAQPVPCLWCPGHPAQAGSPQLPLPDTHQLHYLGTPEPFLHYLGLKGKLGAREDV